MVEVVQLVLLATVALALGWSPAGGVAPWLWLVVVARGCTPWLWLVVVARGCDPWPWFVALVHGRGWL